MEAASSPMMSPASALTLTSVEINDIVNTDNTNASKSVTGIANTTTTTTTTSTFAASGDAQWVYSIVKNSKRKKFMKLNILVLSIFL